MLNPLVRTTPRRVAGALVCVSGLLLMAPVAHAAQPVTAAGPALTVTVTDTTGSGRPVRAGDRLQYRLAWATNSVAYADARIDVELDGSKGTQLLDQLAAPGGTVASSLSTAQPAAHQSIGWALGPEPRDAVGSVSWTALITGAPSDGIPAICTGGALSGPPGGGAPTAVAAPACTVPSAALVPAATAPRIAAAIRAPDVTPVIATPATGSGSGQLAGDLWGGAMLLGGLLLLAMSRHRRRVVRLA